MLAMVLQGVGAPLVPEERPAPEPGPGEVRIRAPGPAPSAARTFTSSTETCPRLSTPSSRAMRSSALWKRPARA
ncbi:hypothetical protein HNR01_000478 [Methylorubrum rhodesianum]|jgi:hypothetical protein|nr:hypothetical protein [Methylorubrum rhodesianum]